MSDIAKSTKMQLVLLAKWLGYTPCFIPAEGNAKYRAMTTDQLAEVEKAQKFAFSIEPQGRMVCKIEVSDLQVIDITPIFEMDLAEALKLAEYIHEYMPKCLTAVNQPEKLIKTIVGSLPDAFLSSMEPPRRIQS